MALDLHRPRAPLPSALAPVGVVWLALVGVALVLRPLMPIDETRYAGVAWEMWARGDFLVPHLNGHPYSDKPPLLFWTMHAGWLLFGVTEWWTRLVGPLFALAALALSAVLGARLWPARPAVATSVPWIVLGTALWAAVTTLTMFDTAMTCLVLIGLLGVLRAWRTGSWTGWLVLGVAIGLGILTKGPVVLLFTLPAALAAPWWSDAPRPWRRWYAGVLGAVGLGAVIALAWAIPAAERGGEVYRHAILWRQTANRLAGPGADHHEPAWWYLAALPLVLTPWWAWPPLWRAGPALRGLVADAGTRFAVSWIVPALVALSLISGKQPHYLLPLLPAVALVAAWMLDVGAPGRRRWDAAPVAALIAAFGLALALGPWSARIAPSGGPLPRIGGLVVLALALVLAAARSPGLRTVGLASPGLVLVVHLAIVPGAVPAHDVRPLAALIHAWQDFGRPVGHVGAYFGQYQFYGRLRRPLERVPGGQERQWLIEHPGGKVITYQDRRDPVPAWAEYVQPYRERLVLVAGDRLLREPGASRDERGTWTGRSGVAIGADGAPDRGPDHFVPKSRSPASPRPGTM